MPTRPGSVDILIRSYYRDARWLALALRSIELFVSGCRRVVVVLPERSMARVDPAELGIGSTVCIRTCEDFADDYAGQQITKLHADHYSDADVIALLDSDHVFVGPCDLADRLFQEGALRMTFSSSSCRPAGDGWRRCPGVFLGQPVPLDLTGGPIAVPGDLFASVRAFCARVHGRSMTEYALDLPIDRLCELALLRGYALTHERERFVWVDAARQPLLPECRIFWSRGQTPAGVADELPPALLSATAAWP